MDHKLCGGPCSIYPTDRRTEALWLWRSEGDCPQFPQGKKRREEASAAAAGVLSAHNGNRFLRCWHSREGESDGGESKLVIGGIQIGCFCTGHYVHFWVLAHFSKCVGHLEFNMRSMASKVLDIILDDQWVVE